MIAEADREAKGEIEFRDFIELMAGKMTERQPSEEILNTFLLFDEDKTGIISFANLKRVALELGETMTDEELQYMISEADRDNDGSITIEDFTRILNKTSLV